jgi:hypothetical protein
MYILAWSINHGDNDIEDFFILCHTQREAEMELETMQACVDGLHCAAIAKVVEATEPQWMDGSGV